jgi:hypothetical protein
VAGRRQRAGLKQGEHDHPGEHGQPHEDDAAPDADEQDQVPGEVGGEGEGRQPDRHVAGEQDRGREGGEQADDRAADGKSPIKDLPLLRPSSQQW